MWNQTLKTQNTTSVRSASHFKNTARSLGWCCWSSKLLSSFSPFLAKFNYMVYTTPPLLLSPNCHQILFQISEIKLPTPLKYFSWRPQVTKSRLKLMNFSQSSLFLIFFQHLAQSMTSCFWNYLLPWILWHCLTQMSCSVSAPSPSPSGLTFTS